MSSTSTDQPKVTEQATARAGEVARIASDDAREVASVAKQDAMDLTRDAAHHARAIVGEARNELRTHASTQTEKVSGTLRDLSSQLRAVADGRGAPEGVVLDISRQAADSTARFADRLEQGGIDGMMADIKGFARRRPGMFLVAALGAGFVAGRMLRNVDTSALTDAMKGQDGGQGESTPMGEMPMGGMPMADAGTADYPAGDAALLTSPELTGQASTALPPEGFDAGEERGGI